MIFISYSRKDYYFAESLTFQLIKHGVEVWLDSKDLEPSTAWSEVIEAAIDAASCLILVVSPDSLKSAIVRREWQRARSQGKRIIAVLFRKKTTPPELESAEVIDFQRSFEPALKQLVFHLASGPSSSNLTLNSYQPGLALRLPPAVASILSLLACAFLIPLLILLLSPDVYKEGLITIRSIGITKLIVAGVRFDPSVLTVFVKTMFLLLAVLYVRIAFLDFLLRRMSMTRLALFLAFGVYVWGAPLLQQLLGPSIPQWVPGVFMRLLRNNWPFSVILFFGAFAASLAGLWTVLFKCPGDLLRWMPTGHAWQSYRVKHAPKAIVTKDTACTIKTLKRFKLLYDARDALLAERVRRELCLAGATDTPNDSEKLTSILLLTNCARLDWIEKQAQRLRGRFVTFLGTNISVPNSLDWLWRIHWVDFRNWDARRLVNQQGGLPLIPEALTQPRFPPLVNLTHHLLCALGALLFNCFNTVQPQASQNLVANAAMGVFGLFVPFVWAIPARRLVKKEMP